MYKETMVWGDCSRFKLTKYFRKVPLLHKYGGVEFRLSKIPIQQHQCLKLNFENLNCVPIAYRLSSSTLQRVSARLQSLNRSGAFLALSL